MGYSYLDYMHLNHRFCMCILKLFFLIMQINSFKLAEYFKEEYVNIVQPLYLPPYWCNNHHFLE